MNLHGTEVRLKHGQSAEVRSLCRRSCAQIEAVGATVEEELTGGAGSRYRMAGAAGASAPRQPRRIAAPDCDMGRKLFLVDLGPRSCHNQLACPDQAHTGGSAGLNPPAHLAQVSAMERLQKTPQDNQ